MGCGASRVTPLPEAAAAPPLAPPSMVPVSPSGALSLARRSSTGLIIKESPNKRLAIQMSEQEGFWSDEAFQDLSRNGQPPQDARVLNMLLNDDADLRLKRAAVNVYMADAAAEWGEELLEHAQIVPSLAAAFGLMAGIMDKVHKPQVNRSNCKLLQEVVRSVAVVLSVVLRQFGQAGIRQYERHLHAKLLELTRAMLAIRSLLSNYSHEHCWVRMMYSAKKDKARFEALHFHIEQLVQNAIGVLSDHPWSAPPDGYLPYMERAAAKMVELSGKKTLRDATSILMRMNGACQQLGAVMRVDGQFVQKALQTEYPQLPLDKRTHDRASPSIRDIAKLSVNSDVRATEAKQQFEALKAIATAPKSHSHKSKAERDAAIKAEQDALEQEAAVASQQQQEEEEAQQQATDTLDPASKVQQDQPSTPTAPITSIVLGKGNFPAPALQDCSTPTKSGKGSADSLQEGMPAGAVQVGPGGQAAEGKPPRPKAPKDRTSVDGKAAKRVSTDGKAPKRTSTDGTERSSKTHSSTSQKKQGTAGMLVSHESMSVPGTAFSGKFKSTGSSGKVGEDPSAVGDTSHRGDGGVEGTEAAVGAQGDGAVNAGTKKKKKKGAGTGTGTGKKKKSKVVSTAEDATETAQDEAGLLEDPPPETSNGMQEAVPARGQSFLPPI